MVALEVVNANKDRVRIHVDVSCDSWSKSPHYYIDLEIKPYRKRNSFYLSYELKDNYRYRSLDRDGNDRKEYAKAACLQYITEEQLTQALINAYNSLKPTADNIFFR